MSDSATVPADLAELKARQLAAAARLQALPADAPAEQRAEYRAVERGALLALLAHPEYGQTHWKALYDAATGQRSV
jgi:hypothetical protein